MDLLMWVNWGVLIKKILLFGVLVIIVFILFLACIAITDYNPEEKEVSSLVVENNKDKVIKINTPLSILTFNLGYCGLDEYQDFFLSKGKMSRSRSAEQTETNLKNITKFLNKEKPSFLLLQEVDINSSRSFYINELEYLKEALPKYSSTFAVNYKVLWVPVPIKNPMGYVYSGLVSLSQNKINESLRHQYPGKEKFYIQLFLLDRCFLEQRIPTENGKELILINSHLSVLDKDGEIRKKQLMFLKEYIAEEYKKENYIIVGGDWNHLLSESNLFNTIEKCPDWLCYLPENFTLDEFIWAIDKKVPTVRTNSKAYQEGVNFLAVIDGFLISPNVEIKKVYGHQLNFENSDHNPVTLEFELR